MITGEDLKAMRLNAGMTQQTMSKKLSCDRRTIHNYELGVSDIPASRLFLWLQCCKLDLSALLNQIKVIRGQAIDNGNSKLLNLISLMLVVGPLWHQKIITPIYLCLLTLCTLYGIYKKDINIIHIAGFIFISTAISNILFETGIINPITPEENGIPQSFFIYGTQFLFNFITVLILIFRVEISRILSNSKKVTLTYFDGIFHWFFLYMAFINLLAFVEEVAWSHFDMKSWTLIYDNFEGLIYIAWALCCGTLLTMMITSAKSPPPSVNKTMED